MRRHSNKILVQERRRSSGGPEANKERREKSVGKSRWGFHSREGKRFTTLGKEKFHRSGGGNKGLGTQRNKVRETGSLEKKYAPGKKESRGTLPVLVAGKSGNVHISGGSPERMEISKIQGGKLSRKGEGTRPS